jgi:ferredoxin
MPSVSVHSIETRKECVFKASLELGEIVYDGLDRQGHTLPHGCLSGSCGSCRVEVMEGNEFLSPAGAIECDTVEHLTSGEPEKFAGKTIRLTCRAKMASEGEVKIVPL